MASKRKLNEDPIIIAVASQKGGVGKTTIATNLAVCFALDGYKVKIVDADPQQSAMSFREFRQADDIVCSANTGSKMHLDLPKEDCFDIIIIDVGGRDTDALRSAILASAWGMVLIPFLSSQYDTDSFKDTMKIVNEIRAITKIKAYALFNQVNSQTNISKATYEYLLPYQEENNFEILKTIIHSRTTFKEAIGEGVIELGATKAKKEMTALFKEIKQKLDL